MLGRSFSAIVARPNEKSLERIVRSSQVLACSTTRSAPFSSSSTLRAGKPPRVYRYAIDVHGQLFLHDTVPKNLTSCFKNPQFLNFFLTRVKPLDKSESNVDQDRVAAMLQDEEWSERGDFTLGEANHVAKIQGYHWLSPCQGEYNFIRAADSPIVFRELNDNGNLSWAGDFEHAFEPDKLKVDADTGYVYHPSPTPSLRSVQKRVDSHGRAENPFGAYSLLSSALVLQKLASGLDLDPDRFSEGFGGSVEWQGRRYEMKTLANDDVARHRRRRVDDRQA